MTQQEVSIYNEMMVIIGAMVFLTSLYCSIFGSHKYRYIAPFFLVVAVVWAMVSLSTNGNAGDGQAGLGIAILFIAYLASAYSGSFLGHMICKVRVAYAGD